MLKLYSDKAFLPPDRSGATILYPFWGAPQLDAPHPERTKFDELVRVGTQFLSFTALEDADVGVLPIEWEQPAADPVNNRIAAEFVPRVVRAGKPCVIFCYGDFDEPLPFPEALIYRTTLYRSRQLPNERAMPAWCVDLLKQECGGELNVRPKRASPVVGFCGLVPPFDYEGVALRQRLWRLRVRGMHLWQELKRSRQIAPALRVAMGEPGYAARLRALEALAGEPRLETNFIRRHSYFGGAVQRGSFAVTSAAQVRREYVDNILNSDYVLCARGGGNFSFRLYETLALGRIPVFVDTDCVLPDAANINWRDCCVWVDEREIPHIGDTLLEFHARHSDAQLRELQQECRRLWETRLSPQGFFAHLYAQL